MAILSKIDLAAAIATAIADNTTGAITPEVLRTALGHMIDSLESLSPNATSAASTFGNDNRLVRSDGPSRGLQASAIEVDDSGNISGIQTMNAEALTVSQFIGNFSGALAADDTYNGHPVTGLNAGATIAQWQAVYLDGSSTYQLADADGTGTYPARGLAIAAGTAGNPLSVLTQGTVRNDAWGWTPGGTIYLSTTAGGLTQTAPSTSGQQVQPVGFALTADIAFFHFTPFYATVA